MSASAFHRINLTGRSIAGSCFEPSTGTSSYLFTNMGGLSAMCLHFS
jgi:hypothetical protein